MNIHLTKDTLISFLVEKIIHRLPEESTYVIGVSGIDAAGKTAIAKTLERELSHRTHHHTLFVSGDYFQFPREYKEKMKEPSPALQHIRRTINFESMRNNFFEKMKKNPKVLSLDIVDYDTGEQKIETIDMQYPLIIVVESIYLFQPDILPYLDFKIFLEISHDTALRRAHKRPRDLKLYTDKEGIRKKYTEKNFAGYDLFEEKNNSKKYADVVIDNNRWSQPIVIKEKNENRD